MHTPRDIQPVRIPALHELVVEEIRRAVEMWVYKPGEQLPSERDLADMLSVSRTTVRMATAQLAREGFLSVKRGRGGGYTVEDPALAANRREEVRNNPEKMREIWDFMMIVNVETAQLAAERRSPDDVERLEEITEGMRRAYLNYEEELTVFATRPWYALDLEFYIALASAARNRFLLENIMNVRRKLWLAFSSFQVWLDPTSQGRREMIVAAVRDGDSRLAAARMREHVDIGGRNFERWLERPEEQVYVRPDGTLTGPRPAVLAAYTEGMTLQEKEQMEL